MAAPRKPRIIDQAQIEDVFPTRPALPAPRIDELEQSIEYDSVTALNNVLSELGASESESKGFIMVYRESVTNSKMSEKFLGRFEVIDYADGNLLSYLQSTYGGARYRIRVYHPDGNGMAANKLIDVEDDPHAVKSVQVQAPTNTMDITPILQTMQAGFERMFDAMKTNQPQNILHPTFAEKLQEMQIMADMFKQNQPAPAINYNPVEMMKLGMEMAANSNGDGNNAWVNKVIDTFGPLLLESVVKPTVPTPAQRPALPQPVPRQAQQPEVQQPNNLNTEQDDAMNLMLTGYLKMLNSAAKQDKPVEEYADTILNLMPKSEMPGFDKMLRATDWQVQLSKYSASINTYPGWFSRLRDVLMEFIDEDASIASAADIVDEQQPVELTAKEFSDTVLVHENANTGKPAD
jgi:hypothetical protein